MNEIRELFRRLSFGVYVVGAAHDEQRDTFTAAWVMHVSFNPLGARIDERTTVFTMGRTVARFLASGTVDIAHLIARACDADPRRRLQILPEFYAAWAAAASIAAFTT